jgi:hypothetical protein
VVCRATTSTCPDAEQLWQPSVDAALHAIVSPVPGGTLFSKMWIAGLSWTFTTPM